MKTSFQSFWERWFYTGFTLCVIKRLYCNKVLYFPATRYCWMMEGEGGLEVLERIKIQPNLYYKVNTLVDTITKIMEENKGVIPVEDDY